MKTHTRICFFLTSFTFLAVTAVKAQNKIIKEGAWRGVFTVNERQVPFNFEFRTGGAKRSLINASFALVNGTRRVFLW